MGEPSPTLQSDHANGEKLRLRRMLFDQLRTVHSREIGTEEADQPHRFNPRGGKTRPEPSCRRNFPLFHPQGPSEDSRQECFRLCTRP